jgi:hypothetical protein
MSRIRRNRINNDKSKLCCFGYVDYIVLASTLAISISEEVNTTDINILSDFFAVLADELALIGSVKSCPENSDEDSSFVAPVPAVSISRSNSKVKKRKKVKKVYKKV